MCWYTVDASYVQLLHTLEVYQVGNDPVQSEGGCPHAHAPLSRRRIYHGRWNVDSTSDPNIIAGLLTFAPSANHCAAQDLINCRHHDTYSIMQPDTRTLINHHEKRHHPRTRRDLHTCSEASLFTSNHPKYPKRAVQPSSTAIAQNNAQNLFVHCTPPNRKPTNETSHSMPPPPRPVPPFLLSRPEPKHCHRPP